MKRFLSNSFSKGGTLAQAGLENALRSAIRELANSGRAFVYRANWETIDIRLENHCQSVFLSVSMWINLR